jgi:hypothetical protein
MRTFFTVGLTGMLALGMTGIAMAQGQAPQPQGPNQARPLIHGLRSIDQELDHLKKASAPVTLEQAESSHILQTLWQTGGVVGGPDGAAARLGLKRTTLISMMRRLGINPGKRSEAPARWRRWHELVRFSYQSSARAHCGSPTQCGHTSRQFAFSQCILNGPYMALWF